MSIKGIKIAFIALVFAATAVPLLFLDTAPAKLSVRENRMLQEFPAFAEHPDLSLVQRLARFAQEFEEYIKDRIGFRLDLVAIGQDIEALFEPVVYTDGGLYFVNGRQGHKYFAYNQGWMIKKFQGEPLLTDEELEAVAAMLNQISACLKERDIPMIVFFCPDKDSVYPEYYPSIFKQAEPPIPLDAVTDYMRENVDADVYNIKDTLISYKDEYMTYNKAEGDLEHYNAIGAFIEYQELIKHVQKYFPDLKMMSFDDVTISYGEDGVPSVEMNNMSRVWELSESFFAGLPEAASHWHYVGFANDEASPTALFIRDSYYDFGGYGVFTAANFRYSIGIHYSYIANYKEIIDLFQPDVVIVEVAERQLPSFAEYVVDYYERQ
jgi:hypothetical protein